LSRAGVGLALDIEVEKRGDSLAHLLDKNDEIVRGLFNKVQSMGHASGFTQPDHYIAKATSPKVHADAGDGKLHVDDADADDGDNIESLVRNWMKENPGVTSKSKAYDAVMRSDAGRKIMARDRAKAGIVA
jgi:hypothetical protein